MRTAQPIVVNGETRRKLEQQARGRSTPARAVMRSRIVLLAAEGMLNKQITKTLRVTPRMVTLWRGRFLELGIEGLLKDAPRPGRTPAITSQVTLIGHYRRSRSKISKVLRGPDTRLRRGGDAVTLQWCNKCGLKCGLIFSAVKAVNCRSIWWALQDSNLRRSPCESNNCQYTRQSRGY